MIIIRSYICKVIFSMNKLFLFIMISTLSYGQKNILFTPNQLTGQSEIHITQNKKFGLIPEVASSFKLMRAAALKDSISIKIISSFRSFNQQKEIWNQKFKKNDSMKLSINKNIFKIIEYSTIPGTSRHHWGTDIDIIDSNIKPEGDVLLTEKFYGKGPYAKLKSWLNENSKKFGFYLVYTNDKMRKGFNHEPWHYSYKPISKYLLKEFLNINFTKLFLESEVLGSEYLTYDFIKYYKKEFLLGISSELKE